MLLNGRFLEHKCNLKLNLFIRYRLRKSNKGILQIFNVRTSEIMMFQENTISPKRQIKGDNSVPILDKCMHTLFKNEDYYI